MWPAVALSLPPAGRCSPCRGSPPHVASRHMRLEDTCVGGAVAAGSCVRAPLRCCGMGVRGPHTEHVSEGARDRDQAAH